MHDLQIFPQEGEKEAVNLPLKGRFISVKFNKMQVHLSINNFLSVYTYIYLYLYTPCTYIDL